MKGMTIGIIVGVIVFLFIIGGIVFLVSQKNKQPNIPQDSRNPNIEIQPVPTTSLQQTNALKNYQVDPLTAQLNASITQEIVQAPQPVKYDLKTVTSNQLELDIVPSFNKLQCVNADKGSFITQLDVYSGQFVDGLNIKCSDDQTGYVRVGGSGGTLNPIISDKVGFNKLILKSGKWLDSITFAPQGSQTKETRGGGGGGGPYTIDCGVTGKLVGLTGTSGNFINSLNGICATPIY